MVIFRSVFVSSHKGIHHASVRNQRGKLHTQLDVFSLLIRDVFFQLDNIESEREGQFRLHFPSRAAWRGKRTSTRTPLWSDSMMVVTRGCIVNTRCHEGDSYTGRPHCRNRNKENEEILPYYAYVFHEKSAGRERHGVYACM